MKLVLNGLVKLILGFALMALFFFGIAGTFDYMGAWHLLALLFVPMLILGIVLLIKAPDLLAKRLNVKEKQKTQKGVVGLSGLVFLVGFVLAPLDHRFAWTEVPQWAQITAAVLFLLSYGMYAEVMRENAYLSRTVEVQENQKVVDTGLYGIVRHPMYFATTIMFLTIPVILGSFVALIPFVFYPVLMVVRIIDEEKLLTAELSGYAEYKKNVKYRLIPYIW